MRASVGPPLRATTARRNAGVSVSGIAASHDTTGARAAGAPPRWRRRSTAGRSAVRRSVASRRYGTSAMTVCSRPTEGRLEALGGLVVEQPVPPVAGDVLGQDDDRDRRLLVRRPGLVEDVEVGDERRDERPVRRLDDDQRHARAPGAPSARAASSPPRGPRSRGRPARRRDDGRPNLTAWTTARLRPLTGMTTRCSRCGALEHQVVADRAARAPARRTGGG